LPSQGIASKAMQAAVFRERSAAGQSRVLSSQYGLLRAEPIGAFASGASAQQPSPLGAEEFHVLSQRFDDGPALVSMTDEARWALEAAYPGLRVVEVTRYYLPGLRPRRRGRKGIHPAGLASPSGQTAVLDGGDVFLGDLKQQVLQAWQAGTASNEGAGVLIGLVDTGVDASHPALNHAVQTLRNLLPGTPPGAGGPVDWGVAEADRAGHGTHVAGIICAAPGFGGPPGVAPKAGVASYRVFPDNPSGPRPAENYVVIDAIRAAIDDGCHVINLSIEGASLKEDGVRSAISDAWNQGVICVAAAGNGWGLPVSYPAAMQHCVAVTALGRLGAFPPLPAFQALVSNERSSVDPDVFLAAFSNYGPRVQFIAPGHAIVSTFPGNQWWFESGTSMAAPFVSGVLARVLSDTPKVLHMIGDAQRSAAMIQLLVARASLMGMPQRSHEGHGWPK
jgi:subtilisin